MYIPVEIETTRRLSQTPFTVLAGDIGATKSNLALIEFKGKTFSFIDECRYRTKDFNDAGGMITVFLEAHKAPDVICFGVAGPVQNGKVRVTNVPWQMDSEEISGRNNNVPVYLINDLEAAAYGIALLEADDIHTLYDPLKKVAGNIALISPGTGLGEAGLYWDGRHYHPFATEGGHCDFAPHTRLDTQLYFFLQRRFGHVSWERVISGNGIHDIYEFLHLKKSMEIPTWLAEKMLTDDPAAVISKNAEESHICRETMNLFIGFLAAEAANLALKLKATGGIFIGGGIIIKILKLIDSSLFLKNFQDCGRMKSLLEDIPVKIILNEKSALLGAAYYGACKF